MLFRSYKSSAWLYLAEGKYYEWIISPEGSDVRAWSLSPNGDVNGTAWTTVGCWGIRPTFYLKENVLYAKGDGTLSNPYRIAL